MNWAGTNKRCDVAQAADTGTTFNPRASGERAQFLRLANPQGLGRLVRREGIPHNRRIHFLDARIHDSKWIWLLQPMVRALGAYQRRHEV